MAGMLPTMDSLQGLYNLPVEGFQQGLDLYKLQNLFANQEKQTGNLNNQLKQQEYEQNQRLNPIKVQQAGAELESTLFGNQRLGRENKMAEATYDQELDKKFREYALKASDDDLKFGENQAQQMMRHPDPQVRAKGEQIMRMTKDVWTTREKELLDQKGKMDLQAAQGKTQKEVANIYASRHIGGGGSKDPSTHTGFMTQFNKVKEAENKYNMLVLKIAELSAQDPSDPLIQVYMAMLNEPKFIQSVNEERARKVNPGDYIQAPDTKEFSRRVPAQVTPTVPTAPNPATAARPERQQEQLDQKKEDWINRAMKANPEMTREQVIEQGKKIGKL